MATSGFPALDSYSTAVALLPPAHLQHPLNLLRSANDKSFPRWTSHITMIFPFVQPSVLGIATRHLRSALESTSLVPFELKLDHVGKFNHKSYNTVYLAPSATTEIQALWKTISTAVGYKGRPFAPHLTLGQARSDVQLSIMEEKGTRILRNHNLSWDAGSIVILCKDDADGGKMKILEEISFGSASFAPASVVPEHPLTYTVSDEGWAPLGSTEATSLPDATLRVTTLNILADDIRPLEPRFALFKRDILSRPSDILCLQEVPDTFLPVLLSDPDIRSRYIHSTYAPTSVLPNWQNIAVLSSLPFTWQRVELGESKHKTASILTFPLPSPLILAVVHFTAGHKPQLLARRDVEAAALLSHLRTHYAGAEWLIVGDMNFNTDALPSFWTAGAEDTMEDVWSLRHPGDAGVTYDPGNNALAGETVQQIIRAFRYDRVCVKKRGQVKVKQVEIVKEKVGEQPASDHWALWAELDIGGSLAHPATKTHSAVQQEMPSRMEALTLSIPVSTAKDPWVDEDAQLEQWVRDHGGYPSEEQEGARLLAIQTIREVLGGAMSTAIVTDEAQPQPVSLPPGVKIVFEAVGSRMLGADTASSDLDVLAVGNLGQNTFFNLMRARIRAWSRACRTTRMTPTLVLRRFVRDAAVPMMRLQVNDVEVDLQYAPAAKVVERWSEVASIPHDDPLFSLPASTLRVLNAYRDNLRMITLIPAERLPAFRVVLRTLKLFISIRGLSGAKLGFLGGIHLTILLGRMAIDDTSEMISPTALLRAFFEQYANFHFADEIASIGGLTAGSTYRRTHREALAILSVERPIINVAAGATVPNVVTLQAEFKRAAALLRSGHSWTDVCGSRNDAVSKFLSEYPVFVRVDLSFWGTDAMKMRALLGFVESRLVKLLVDLDRHGAPTPRLWPQPFVDAPSAVTPSIQDRTLNLTYLIGIPGNAIHLASNQALGDFERLVHSQENYYDSTQAYFATTVTKPDDLTNIELAPASLAWADEGVDKDEDDDDDDGPAAADVTADAVELTPNFTSSKPSASSQARGGKLRTSTDVYNRLMWDDSVDRSDYMIGYEDRFVGVMEMPLTSWKREVEDEAFVPFHRVVHFRRVSDGAVVWDRRKRVDLVFGSGGTS